MNKRDWTKKINRERYVVRNIVRWIQREYDPKAYIVEGYEPEKDIVSEVMGNIEVKEDRMAHITGNYAFETERGDGQPSGVEGTTSKHFVLVDNEHICIMATETLKFILKEEKRKRQIAMGDTFDNGKKSIGWLIPRETILNSPYINVMERWFPVLQEHEVRLD